MKATLGLRTLCLMLMLGGSVGCASRTAGRPGSNLGDVNTPAWVTRGSGRFQLSGRPVFEGLGQAVGIKSATLSRSTAENRGRAEVAREFEVFCAQLAANYFSSLNDSADASATAAQAPDPDLGDQTVKAFSAAALASVQVVEHWAHPADGSAYALARLELRTFLENLPKIQDIDEPLRAYVAKNAGRVFQSSR